ncbi:hypothetical protein GCM10007933_24110 [Zoogloea oryzae]|uniref:Uncharacterized protein n=1 Tax=Zoogloea oryzae TaxID=310767 RepID=A0ABQ6FDX7_9RHOO|nr:hypothetical protein [Zoogloea oryzae]GLT22950.1 hypothetical protein GCM10007933_24110 [Zoogloea oryzae]
MKDNKLFDAEPLTNAIVELSSKDGNAFLILGLVRRAILQSDKPELAVNFIEEATAHDYDHLLMTCAKYVTIE